MLENPHVQVNSPDSYFNRSVEKHIPGTEYRKGHTKSSGWCPETPDFVCHLRQCARIAPSFEDMKLVYDMNISGNVRGGRVLPDPEGEEARLRGVEHEVRDRTGRAAPEPVLVHEGSKRGPGQRLRALVQLPYAISYFFSAFGPRKRWDGKYGTVIAKFQQQYLRGEPLTVVRPGLSAGRSRT